MELLVIVAIAVAAIAWFLWKDRQFEQSESHPLDGATKAPEPWPFPTARPPEGANKTVESIPVMPTLTNVLDVNKDGKVDIKDAVAAVEVVKEEVKVAVEKTKKATRTTKAKAKAVVAETKKAVKKVRAKKSK